MSRSFALVCCLAAALAAIAAGQIEPAQTPLVTKEDFKVGTGPTTIKIGCMLPFSGDNAVKGEAARNAIMMAMTDAASSPAYKDLYKFILTCKDTQCSSANSPKAADELKKAGVVAVI
jgi:ABC-type branched-subunit amino acid transport system substrate-binding protein